MTDPPASRVWPNGYPHEVKEATSRELPKGLSICGKEAAKTATLAFLVQPIGYPCRHEDIILTTNACS